VIFFSFTVLILILALALVWMFWKVHLVLKARGGIKELFQLKPISAEQIPSESSEEKKEEVKEPKEKEEKSLADKDVDQT
jgi:hypothetical protein